MQARLKRITWDCERLSVARMIARRSNSLQAHATENAAWRIEAPKSPSPPLRLNVVDMRVIALPDRLYDLPDVDAILDHGVANLHVLQRHLVADRDVLPAFELDRPVLVEDQSGQRRSGLDAFDDDDGDAVVRVMQYAVDHGSFL